VGVCVYVWVSLVCGCVCMCGFCNVPVCACVGFLLCGCACVGFVLCRIIYLWVL